MSLRARLTLVYISILATVLLLFGSAVYGTVSLILLQQVDGTLEKAAIDTLSVTRVNQSDQLTVIRDVAVSSGVVIQFWDIEGNLIASTQSFNPLSNLIIPFYPPGLEIDEKVFTYVQIGETQLRVLSLPVISDVGKLGTMQVATNLEAINDAQQDVLLMMIGLGCLAVLAAGGAVWFGSRRALQPLATMTEIALQITRADDLSRRIPQEGSVDNEVGRLVQAFNQSMERMEKLFHAQRRFIADVGHELRTPLTVVKGNVELLRKLSNADPESLQVIESEVDRLTRLVEDLLLLAYAESGKLPLDHKTIELDTILLEVFKQAKILAGGKVEVRIGEIDQVLICGDRDRIKQVILNLMSNAVGYTPDGGEVVVGLGKKENWAYLSVSDDGPGIPKEDIPFIFRRFYRGEKSRTRKKGEKGFGLGLSIANWIVKGHGGRIEVDARRVQGTTFSVWLPLITTPCDEIITEINPSVPGPDYRD